MTLKNVILFSALFISGSLLAQDQAQTLPSVQVKDLSGNSIDIRNAGDSGKFTVISFWATWCAPCIKELEAINEHYSEWQTKYNMQLVAVSIDDARNSKKVKPKVLGYGWEYIIVLDENSDLARAMNVNNPPMLFIVDPTGKIVYTHQGYTAGSEEEIEKQLAALQKK